jgi:dinuclear metal center YbgI/SA1388 family protein
MKINEIAEYLEESIPLAYQEEYDNCGLLTGDPDKEVTGVLVSLDITMEVLEEAVKKQCNLIIAHHPAIFRGLKKLVSGMPESTMIIFAIKNDIALYAIHTNLDNSLFGLNAFVAKRLGLSNLRILEPKAGLLSKIVTYCPSGHVERVRDAMFRAGGGRIGEYDQCSFNLSGHGTFRPSEEARPYVGQSGKMHTEPEIRIEMICPVHREQHVISEMISAHPYEEVAFDIFPVKNTYQEVGPGVIGSLNQPTPAWDILAHIKAVLKVPILRHTQVPGRNVATIALCTGAGGFMASKALRSGADLFLSADLKYHDFFGYEGKMILVDAGHYETEELVKEWLAEYLNKKFPTFAVCISEVNTNPVRYF